MSTPLRELILGEVRAAAAAFLYYDRQNDAELPRGKIQQAVAAHLITVDDIVDAFRKVLEDAVQ